MRIAIIGQQKFGKAVLDAFIERGDTVAGVFCAPRNRAARPIRCASAAEAARPAPISAAIAQRARRRRKPCAASMSISASWPTCCSSRPEEFTSIPRHGTIQFHPSLLPRYRGPSSINWPIIRGDTRTGLTIFRPSDGLDEGPVLLQKETPIGPDDTLGSVYFDRLFPMGIAALMEAADLVVSGRASATVQDESQASYEGWCRDAEAQINWHNHVDIVYNLIRGCNPAPGAWTRLNGKKLQLFDARKHAARLFRRSQGPHRRGHRDHRSELVRDGTGRADRSLCAAPRGRQESSSAAEFCAGDESVGTILGPDRGSVRAASVRAPDRFPRTGPRCGPARRCRCGRPTAPSAIPASS
jgi:methionyl-tRNA formyltransferase